MTEGFGQGAETPIRMAYYSLIVAIRCGLTPDKAMTVMGYHHPFDDYDEPKERKPQKGGRPKGDKEPKCAYKRTSNELKAEVIRLRSQGLFYGEIAGKLGISRTKAYEIVRWAEKQRMVI